MGRTQPHADFQCNPPVMLSACSGPVGQKRRSQPREGPRMAKMAWPSHFAPNCGEGRDFGGYVRRSFEGLLLGS